jgi:hypothetical protein
LQVAAIETAVTEATMKTSTATIITGTAALLVSFSACGGGISLGSNDDQGPDDAGGAGHIGVAPGSGGDGSGTPTVDASISRSRPDASGSIDDASGSSDDSDGSTDGSGNPEGASGMGPGFAVHSSCGYTQVDPHNCGVCGHDCAGGACQAGVCVPLPPGVLASGVVAPTSVAVDASNVYWISEGEHSDGDGGVAGLVQVLKCAKTGCNNSPTLLASGQWDSVSIMTLFGASNDSKDTLHGLTVDGTNVYWATETALFACAIDGCNNSPTVLFTADTTIAAPPSVISVSAGTVYSVNEYGVFGCPASGCLGDGGGSSPPSDLLWNGQAQGVVIDSTSAYWNSNGSLLSCALGGCNRAPTLLMEPNALLQNESIGQIAEDDTYLYYTIGAPTSFQLGNGPGYVVTQSSSLALGPVFSCSKQGSASGATDLVGIGSTTERANPMGLATDGTNVYFTELGDGVAANATDVGRVGKCSVNGCTDSGTTIADHLENPRGIAIDDTNVYWADSGSGILDSNASLLLSVDGRIMTSAK